ncbi:S41 family peptidase [Novosphingopyxis sp.]|uniref:S41 family peptidase n=1 Tax=Novosphingopyxis sp. TaxID=2709690 RepID=UPI003B5BD460
MRKQIGVLAGIVTILSACGGGGGGNGGGNTSTTPPVTTPTPPPPPPPTSTAGCSLTERQNWAADQLDEFYLFPELLPKNPNPAGYATVQDYIDFLTSKARTQHKDRGFTYLTSIEEEDAYYNSGTNAGFGMRLGFTPNNELLIIEAFEGAPALAAGIDRGTQILAIGTSESNLRDVDDIIASSDSGIYDALGPSDPGVSRVFRIRSANGAESIVTVAKTEFELKPVSTRYGAKVINDGGQKVGYVNLRTFIGPAETPLKNAFAKFRKQGITKVVVDLRYNGGGLVSVSELFGNLLGGSRSTSDVFSYTTFRPSLASNNDTTYFDPNDQSIGPMKIAFIGTGGTASASELLMNGFIPYLGADNALIGTNTFGKPVGQIARDRPQCDDRLRVVAFRTENADHQGDYYNGLATVMKTTCVAPDDVSFQLGDPREASTRQALDFLAGRGTCTPIAATASGSGLRTQGMTREMALDQVELMTPPDASTAQRETPGLF